ncbi:MAG: hypothetical protein GX163_11330 [Bacteroidetes bacterium]|jgi:hypothetical protein|nr:hypothetical protein [Bacteroidota bacterium]
MALTRAQRIEKNKTSTSGMSLLFLEILTDDAIRIVNDTIDHEWGGYVWIGVPIRLGSVNYNDKEFPTITLQISNVNKQVGAALALVEGGGGTEVIVRVINTKLLSEPPMQIEYFKIKDSSRGDLWCDITLGCDRFGLQLLHTYTVSRDFCQYIITTGYGGIECGVKASYKALYPECNGSIEDCRQRKNSHRFKGKLGT